MGYWKIVVGHRKGATDDSRSVILGDWLRHDYVAIGWDEDEGQHNVFRDRIHTGDKIVVVAEGFIWAIGEIISELENGEFTKGVETLYTSEKSGLAKSYENKL